MSNGDKARTRRLITAYEKSSARQSAKQELRETVQDEQFGDDLHEEAGSEQDRFEMDANTPVEFSLYDDFYGYVEVVRGIPVSTSVEREREFNAARAQVVDQKYDSVVSVSKAASNVPDTTAQEIFVSENPVLAARQGIVGSLIQVGAHEPAGSTLHADSSVIEPFKTSTKRYDVRDAQPSGLKDCPGYVIVSGSFTKVKEKLQEFASERNVPTLIANRDGRELGLVDSLAKAEILCLEKLGATYLGSNKKPVVFAQGRQRDFNL